MLMNNLMIQGQTAGKRNNWFLIAFGAAGNANRCFAADALAVEATFSSDHQTGIGYQALQLQRVNHNLHTGF
ncbi:hypothetical protein SDC9_176424 [bioreactor metagenome]|uniref:Uncharacterized protein n=1 Tax=bioreactor metagenome TaxID=1076179 RepID=A0A645GQ19_9ZZZZ